MLKVNKVSDNRVDIDLDGTLDAEDMRSALDALVAASEGVSHGRMMYRITDFSMPTLGAIGVEMARLPSLFGLLGKYDKCAVLSDTGWIRSAAELEGAMFPGVDIKGFALDDAATAEQWLSADGAESGDENFPL